jgi:hypothetical protein
MKYLKYLELKLISVFFYFERRGWGIVSAVLAPK